MHNNKRVIGKFKHFLRPKFEVDTRSESQQLKTFSNEPIQTLAILQTSIQSNNWYANPIEIQVVTDDHRSLLGGDLFPALGLSIQQSNNQKTVSQVDQEYCPQIATDFLDIISRIGKSKVQMVRSKFHRNYTPSQ